MADNQVPRGGAVLLGRVIGLPNGQVQVELMPGLEVGEAVAMCNTCIQAFAQRQAQFLVAEQAEKKPTILVPQVGFRFQ